MQSFPTTLSNTKKTTAVANEKKELVERYSWPYLQEMALKKYLKLPEALLLGIIDWHDNFLWILRFHDRNFLSIRSFKRNPRVTSKKHSLSFHNIYCVINILEPDWLSAEAVTKKLSELEVNIKTASGKKEKTNKKIAKDYTTVVSAVFPVLAQYFDDIVAVDTVNGARCARLRNVM